MKTRLNAAILTVTIGFGAVAMTAAPAMARTNSRERAWRTGTYLGGAGTIAALATGHGTWALLAGGATLLSYTQWRHEMKRRHRREDRATYYRYRSEWYRRHHRRHRR